jgi:hypothetical protein
VDPYFQQDLLQEYGTETYKKRKSLSSTAREGRLIVWRDWGTTLLEWLSFLLIVAFCLGCTLAIALVTGRLPIEAFVGK